MSFDGSVVLKQLLDRLMMGLLNGPGMNCRPHNSRQRVDLASLSRLKSVEPEEILKLILGPDESVKLVCKVAPPKGAKTSRIAKKKPSKMQAAVLMSEPAAQSPIQSAADQPLPAATQPTSPEASADIDGDEVDTYTQLQQILQKLKIMTDDARTYIQDTGVHVLSIGFPLLALPPGALGKQISRRVVAPIAFIPIEMTFTRGVNATIEISCYGQGLDRVVPNVALFAWLEQLTGKSDLTREFEDESGARPLREIVMLVNAAARALELDVPEFVPTGHIDKPADDAPDLALPDGFKLLSAPRADELSDVAAILPSAVVGLFPMANQGLIQDMKAYSEGEIPTGPIESFLKAGIALDGPRAQTTEAESPQVSGTRDPLAVANIVTDADPFQKQVITASQDARGVVIHGPPGTGKSQTIVNLIGDHLSRNQRVLFVCDKRTALDVVLNRLSFVGLGNLCAVVHDPQRDQADFYRSVREQLDSLVEAKQTPIDQKKLADLDQELSTRYAQLRAFHASLMNPPAQGQASFHELVGRWLSIADSKVELPLDFASIPLEELSKSTTSLTELFDRATAVGYAGSAWAWVASTDLGAVLARSVDQIRQAASELPALMKLCDQTIDATAPAFVESIDLATQSADRVAVGSAMGELAELASGESLDRLNEDRVTRVGQRLSEAATMLIRMQATPLDRQLLGAANASDAGPLELVRQVEQLQAYLESSKSIFGAFAFGKKREAQTLLSSYGLSLSPESAGRLKSFLVQYKDRVALTMLDNELAGTTSTTHTPRPDAQLSTSLGAWVVFAKLSALLNRPSVASIRADLPGLLSDPSKMKSLSKALATSPLRVKAIEEASSSIETSKLFSIEGITLLRSQMLHGNPLAERLEKMASSVDTYEGVVRIEQQLSASPTGLRLTLRALMAASSDAKAAIAMLERRSLDAEIRKRLAADPGLQTVDAQRVQSGLDRIASLEKDRQQLVAQQTVASWCVRAQKRLGSGGKLNIVGADLKRRFTMSGKNKMRLRKVVQLGNGVEGGDPLFDLRPVWMVSPETVAQLFSRRAMFDVVIFDEASQCRLEEGLPVLARASRVVIAGDEHQLPPTRFFESASLDGSDANDAQTSQELFEKQQSGTEDLLAAALQLQISHAYLNVHYRSKNADLIEFSNRYFYRSKLQALPGHPDRTEKSPPIQLVRVDGVYDSSENESEADKIVEIVRELLDRQKPPSIGIACMNVQQRDVILEALDEAASDDESFGKKLDASRARMGKGSFEGLFVKNLENVQGDERDHMIISTTYGPDAKGKFFRRFGPLQQVGGGRRLNVLVTRAREKVHLITSIPASEYRALPPVPDGQSATGGWLLYAYLKYAEELQTRYSEAVEEPGTDETTSDLTTEAPSKSEALREMTPQIELLNPASASILARAIAQSLLERSVGSIVNFGNEGFNIDVAPRKPDGTTPVGVLVDGTRFEQAGDVIAWEVFRASILKQQGWTLRRVFSPQLFRDPTATLQKLDA